MTNNVKTMITPYNNMTDPVTFAEPEQCANVIVMLLEHTAMLFLYNIYNTICLFSDIVYKILMFM